MRSVIGWCYRNLLKPVLFKFDAEAVHDLFLKIGEFLGRYPITQNLTAWLFDFEHPSLKQTIAGIEFKNPVGLAAGFDKDARLTQILPQVGFGFEEIGSITGEECEGNPKPRLWRHVDIQSLRVYYGLKNKGCQEISNRLSKMKFNFPVAVSIAKTNCAATAQTQAAIDDYSKAYRAFETIADFYVINISCPNAFGGQPFTDPKSFELLLTAIDKIRNPKPIFVKLSPDLSENELSSIAQIAKSHKITGFICTNLTKKHELGVGGISGKSVADLALKQLRFLRQAFAKDFILIACGGIFSANDAYDRIKAGANLVELITGMIFEGPQLIGQINHDLVKLLKADGFTNISQAVGCVKSQ